MTPQPTPSTDRKYIMMMIVTTQILQICPLAKLPVLAYPNPPTSSCFHRFPKKYQQKVAFAYLWCDPLLDFLNSQGGKAAF